MSLNRSIHIILTAVKDNNVTITNPTDITHALSNYSTFLKLL